MPEGQEYWIHQFVFGQENLTHTDSTISLHLNNNINKWMIMTMIIFKWFVYTKYETPDNFHNLYSSLMFSEFKYHIIKAYGGHTG